MVNFQVFFIVVKATSNCLFPLPHSDSDQTTNQIGSIGLSIQIEFAISNDN